MNMISATGRMPASAAPIAAPRIACSDMGVSRTRPAKRVDRPRVTPKTPPPGSQMSSPNRTTLSSDSNRSPRAPLMAVLTLTG